MDNKRVVPFDTGKIKIGVFYQPQSRTCDEDPFMNLLQDALLTRQQREPLLRRFFRRLVGGVMV